MQPIAGRHAEDCPVWYYPFRTVQLQRLINGRPACTVCTVLYDTIPCPLLYRCRLDSKVLFLLPDSSSPPTSLSCTTLFLFLVRFLPPSLHSSSSCSSSSRPSYATLYMPALVCLPRLTAGER